MFRSRNSKEDWSSLVDAPLGRPTGKDAAMARESWLDEPEEEMMPCEDRMWSVYSSLRAKEQCRTVL
jgi:hypothetical protein